MTSELRCGLDHLRGCEEIKAPCLRSGIRMQCLAATSSTAAVFCIDGGLVLVFFSYMFLVGIL
jgi:hypothetical protein